MFSTIGDYPFRFSSLVTGFRARAGARAKSKIDYPKATQLPSPVALANKLLIITRRNFSK
jgi:hypothetical protein